LSGDRTYALVVTALVDTGGRAVSEVHLTIRTRHSADSTGTVPPDSSAAPSDTAAAESADGTPDTAPPGITAATISPCVPPEGYDSSRLPRIYRVDFAFTEALDPVNVPTVTAWAASGRASIRYAEWSAAAVTLVVEVWEVQPEGTECQIHVTGARDPWGNIAPELVLTFFVPGVSMPDETPPELLLSQPASGTLVEPRSLIRDGVRLVFSGPVDTTRVQVQVLLDGRPVAWRLVWGSGGMQLTLRSPLGTTPAEGQSYEVYLTNLRAPTGGQATSTVVAFSTTPSAGVELIAIDCDTTAGNQHLRLSQARGNLVTVELLADRVPRITGWSATVNFDPVQLRYRRGSFQPGTLVPELTPLVDAREGCVSVGGAVLGGGPGGGGSGRLGHLSFEVVDGFSGDAWLEVVDVRLALPAGDVYRSTVASRATISCPSATAPVPILTLDLDPAPGDQGVRAVVGAEAGQWYPVELHLQLAPAVTGWSAALRYDPRYLGYVPGSFYAGDYLAGLVPLVDDRSGMVTIGGSLLGTAASDSGSGWLGTVTFAVQQALVDQTELVATGLALRTVEHVTARSQPAATVTFAGVPVAAISLDSDLAEGDQQQLLVRRLDPGGRVTLQVHVHHARGVDGWSATLTYDPGAFRHLPNGFIATDFIPGFVSLIDEDEGRVSIGGGVLGPAPGADGDGLLGVISLAGLEGARNGATIRLTEYTLHLANGNLIRVQPSDVCVILDLLIAGVTAVSADDPPVSLPAVSALGPGYPNPFNGRTVLPVRLATGDVGWVDVFDAQGQRVRCLAEGLRGPGSFLLPWDGTDDLGRPLAAGVYFVRMQAGTHRQVRRMALIK
ncbi:MAG: FlgD immunoglobulin-like domain containing protein, partial [Candidatus Latescibacterota bacterium]